MVITSKRLTLGTEPDVKFTKNGIMMVVSAAENQRRNMGTEEEPDWQTVNTSWFRLVAFGDTASEFVDSMSKGDSFELVHGYHDWKNIGTDGEDDYRPSYKIVDFKKIIKEDD